MKYFSVNTNKQDIFDIIGEYVDKEYAPQVKETMTYTPYQKFKNNFTSNLLKNIQDIFDTLTFSIN